MADTPTDNAAASTMLVERDVMVNTRDGATIAVDVFRPADSERHPVIFAMSPYGKDVHWPDRFPLFDQVDDGDYMAWETENPERWVPGGYVVVRADTRGTGHSPGLMQLLGRREQEDAYDVVEWCGVQPWSNGRVGMSGISWYAMLAWHVAALQPPHLAAIIPWDGLTDFYREWAYQGGVLQNNFTPNWWRRFVGPNQFGVGTLSDEELADSRVLLDDEIREHPWQDDWHAERTPNLERITIPTLSASSWGSLHLHLRGNVEGYLAVPAEQKRLLLFPGDHITPFYTDWALAERRRFFDHWLAGKENGAETEPKVRLGLREGSELVWRDESDWPLARTEWTPWWLDARDRSLVEQPNTASEVRLHSPTESVDFFSSLAEQRIEVTGPAALRIWISTDAEDLDLFVAITQVDQAGDILPAFGILGQQIPHAIGILRASHRRLDQARSLPHRPFHDHLSPTPVPRNEPFEMRIEIWPTSLVLAPGQRLKLTVSTNDYWHDGEIIHDDPVSRSMERVGGSVTIHTGTDFPSSLILPIIPD